MKKSITFLSSLIFIGFITATLYVFKLPPFQKKEETLKPAANDSSSLPPALNDPTKISRAKSYDELIKKGLALEQNQYSSLAIAEYQEAAKLDPQNPDPFIRIGRIQLRNHTFAEAEATFKQALTLSPNNIESEVYLGRAYLGQRKIAEARDLFNGLQDVNQNVRYYQGIIAAFFGDYDKSKNLLNEAVKMATSDDITRKAANFLGAFSEFDFNQEGENIHLKTLLARSYDQTGEYQMAIAILFDVIKEKKDYRDAWTLLGYAYLQLEQYPDALDAFTAAKKLDPQKPEISFFLGLTYYGMNNLTEAVQALEDAKNNGFQPVIQINQKLAEIYLQLKQYQKSADNYEQVVALNDTDIHYYVKPIWVYLEKLDDPAKALSLAQRAKDHHPADAMSYNLLGWAQIYNGELTTAEQNLLAAVHMDPKLDAAYLNLGLLKEKKGQFDQAIAYYRQAHTLGQGNSITQSAAERYGNLMAQLKNNNTLKANVFNPSP